MIGSDFGASQAVTVGPEFELNIISSTQSIHIHPVGIAARVNVNDIFSEAIEDLDGVLAR